MKTLLLASILLVVYTDVLAAIGSGTILQPSQQNPGPFPPHMTQQWPAPSPPNYPVPVYTVPVITSVPQLPPAVIHTGGNMPPTPFNPTP
jgi:hypothetical protein